MDKVSNKAKASLIEQQLSLVDVVDKLTNENDSLWESYRLSSNDEYWEDERWIKKESKENIAADHIKVISDMVFAGITPPADVLIPIAEYFAKYRAPSSTMTLDECFKLKHKPKIGNPIKQQEWIENKAAVLMAIGVLRKIFELKGKKLSIENAATMVIEKWNLEADAEALKKGYIKLGVDNSFGDHDFTPIKDALADMERVFEALTNMYLHKIPLKRELLWTRKATRDVLIKHLAEAADRLGEKVT